jgi:serine phosphatase RsbU (regulator of sigma subunit)
LANKKEPSFENNVINFEKGDKLFIFSDGLPDQTGGPEGKKYMNKRIRENLNSIKMPQWRILPATSQKIFTIGLAIPSKLTTCY